jgi:hypothetical protein
MAVPDGVSVARGESGAVCYFLFDLFDLGEMCNEKHGKDRPRLRVFGGGSALGKLRHDGG